MTSNNRFIALMASVPVMFGLLSALWLNAANAAESVREPGRCVTSEVFVTDRKTGEQHISVKTVCECSAENPCTTKVAAR